MSKTIEQLREELNAKIPREAVMQREGGGGKSFSYLAGHYVIARLNEVFGQGNWAYFTEECKCVHAGTVEAYGKSNHTAHYIARVRLEVPALGHAIFSDVGYGDGSDKQNIGKAHELAAKESVTDALKRCAKNLGMSMGLALYDKDQINVEDEPKAVAQRPVSKAEEVSTRTIENPKPDSVGQVRTESSTSIPAAPPEDRQMLNEMISKMSKVIVAKKIKSLPELQSEMKSRFGTSKKEELKDNQAKDLYTYLRGII